MAEYLMDGEVHEVPVVRLLSVMQIKRQDFIAGTDGSLVVFEALRCQPFELRHKNQQAAEPHLMPTIHQKFRHFAQGKVLWNSTYHLARLWHFQSQELIALAILARARLEEPHEYPSLLLILQRLHVSYNLFRRHLFILGTKIQKIPDITKDSGIIYIERWLIVNARGRRQPWRQSVCHWP